MRHIIFGLALSTFGIAACSSDENNPSSGNAGGKDAGGGAAGSSGAGGATATGGAAATGGTGTAGTGGLGTGGACVAEPTDGGLAHIDRSCLQNVGLAKAPLDYSNANVWVCRPGIDDNACYGDFDATAFYADGTSKVIPHQRATNPPFDCFYVYPTVDLTGMGNTTNLSDISHVLDPLLAQAGRFSRICEVYAPLYRQVSLGGGTATTGDAGASVGLKGDGSIALGDVKAAFQYYMDHWNNGRKFVLIGHSQGTLMLQGMMTDLFEGDAGAGLRAQLISALLIGGGPTVPANQNIGGTFKTIPACTSAGQVGCIVAYNSFAKEAPPPSNTLFGKAPAGSEVICTPPPMLDNNTGLSKGYYVPKKINTAAFIPNTPMTTLPSFDTPFAVFPDMFQGSCVNTNGYHYLEVSVGAAAGDKRSVPPYRNTATEGLGFGLHVVDYNLFLEDLIQGVKLQADAALK